VGGDPEGKGVVRSVPSTEEIEFSSKKCRVLWIFIAKTILVARNPDRRWFNRPPGG